MASSTATSTTNHLDIQDHQQSMFLEEIYHNLENVFAENDFDVFQKECECATSILDKHPKPIYFPVKFNPAKHKINSATIKEYLNRLSDEDANADLKSLQPVEIINDGSVLFRAVASLLEFSSEEMVRELRLRSLIDVALNSFRYAAEYTEIQKLLLNPNQTSMKNWSNLVHQRSQMDEPNLITVLTLIALAKAINIPIRSVYLSPSTQESNENSNHIYKLLNRVFYPSHNQHHSTETTPKPIVILWWCTQTRGVTYPDTVVPLFPADEHNVKYSESQILSGQSYSVIQRRGTFILIFQTVSGSKMYSTDKRISDMKVTIIELMKIIAANAKPGDIIEVNTCDEKLTQPPLIPFCEAIEVTSQKNLNLINTIQFHKGTHPNLSICISAALDKLARQSVYYTDFFYVVDNLLKRTGETSQEKSILRVLTESPSINSQIIVCSDESIDSEECFESYRTLQVNYLHNTNNTRNHPNSNIIRDQIDDIYKKNRSSHGSEKSEAPAGFIPGISAEHGNNSDPSPQNTSDTHKPIGSPRNLYRVPDPNPLRQYPCTIRMSGGN